MKKIVTALLCFGILASAIPAVRASDYVGPISPALEIIRNKTKLWKSGENSAAVKFSQKDFSELLGDHVTHITILSLPQLGALKLNGTDVEIYQSIAKSELNKLTFIPANDQALQTGFQFKSVDSTNAQALECVITLSESPRVPRAENLTLATYRDMMIASDLSAASDWEEGDRVIVCSAPANGILTLSESGNVLYRPKTGFEGQDSFEYQICGKDGALSSVAKVKIKVEKPFENVFFADLKDSPLHYAAVDFCKYTSFDAAKDENGNFFFDADQPVPVAEVEVMLKKILAQNSSYKEVFESDDDERSAISALICSVVGSESEESVTRLQAAQIVSAAVQDNKVAEKGIIEKLLELF